MRLINHFIVVSVVFLFSCRCPDVDPYITLPEFEFIFENTSRLEILSNNWYSYLYPTRLIFVDQDSLIELGRFDGSLYPAGREISSNQDTIVYDTLRTWFRSDRNNRGNGNDLIKQAELRNLMLIIDLGGARRDTLFEVKIPYYIKRFQGKNCDRCSDGPTEHFMVSKIKFKRKTSSGFVADSALPMFEDQFRIKL